MKCDKCRERNRKAPATMEADREFSECVDKSGLREYLRNNPLPPRK
jgi:hypothetical protein